MKSKILLVYATVMTVAVILLSVYFIFDLRVGQKIKLEKPEPTISTTPMPTSTPSPTPQITMTPLPIVTASPSPTQEQLLGTEEQIQIGDRLIIRRKIVEKADNENFLFLDIRHSVMLDVMCMRLGFDKNDYVIDSKDLDGGYILRYIGNVKDENRIEYTLNTVTGIIYDSWYQDYKANIFYKEGSVHILTEKEIEDSILSTFAKDTPIVKDDPPITFSHVGNIVYAIPYAEVDEYDYWGALYMVNPITGDVYDYYSSNYLGNVK